MQSPPGWDDLRVVLALARGRTLQEAARRLGSDPSTVFRRARALEARMGTKLFERTREGYRLTEAGEDAAQAAERMESEVLGLESRIGRGDLAPSGALRITTTDTVLRDLLLPRLADFAARYHDIRLEIAASNEFADLTKRDADIAIRATAKPPGHLVGRPLGAVSWSLYAHKRLARGLTSPASLAAAPWVVPDDSLAQHPTVRWRARHHPRARIALRLNSIAGVRDALAQGLGVGTLPSFVAAATPGLVAVGDPIPELDSELWILTHRDFRDLARVRAFFDFALAALAPTLRR